MNWGPAQGVGATRAVAFSGAQRIEGGGADRYPNKMRIIIISEG